MASWTELEHLQPELRKIVAGDEDILQDANLRLLRRRASIRNLSRYARTTARRCRIDRSYQLRHRCIVRLPDQLRDPAPTPVEAACEHEERERLETAMQHLTPRQRDALQKPGRANNSNRYKAKLKLRKILRRNEREDLDESR